MAIKLPHLQLNNLCLELCGWSSPKTANYVGARFWRAAFSKGRPQKVDMC